MLEDALLEVAQEDKYGKTEIANAGEVLRVLWEEVGAEAFEKWVGRAVIFLQSKKVLLSWLHGQDEDGELQTEERDNRQGTSKENHAVIALRGLWEEWQNASTPHRRKPAEQLARKLDKTLLELSRETASVEKFMCCVRIATKGEGFMPEALPADAENAKAREGTSDDVAGGVGGSADAGCLTPWDVQSRRVFDGNGKWPAIYGGEGGGHGYALIENTLAFQFCGDRDNASVSASDKAYCIPANPMSDRGQAVVYEPKSALEENWAKSAVKNAIRANASKSAHVVVPIHDKATRFQGGGDTRDNDGSGNGLGVSEDGVEYTLTAADRHGVAYSVDCRNMCLNEELSGTLQAKENGGQSLNYQAPVVYSRQRSDELIENAVASCQSARQYKDNTDLVIVSAKPPRKYIVRRLTPTECARLQGFPDNWGELTPYDGDDAFWQGVYKTACEIKGGKYTPKKDLRKWYNGLHTDSAEYKMWGNGIALPCAEYVIRSIKRRAQ